MAKLYLGTEEIAANGLHLGSQGVVPSMLLDTYTTLTINLSGTTAQFDKFKIDNYVYDYSEFVNNSLSIPVPMNRAITWSATTKSNTYTVTPSNPASITLTQSGTLNLTVQSAS